MWKMLCKIYLITKISRGHFKPTEKTSFHSNITMITKKCPTFIKLVVAKPFRKYMWIVTEQNNRKHYTTLRTSKNISLVVFEQTEFTTKFPRLKRDTK